MKHKIYKSSFLLIIFWLACSMLPLNVLYASNTGPNAPEVAGFEPFDATDMVNLGSGDLAYTMPLMEVGGFPITMAYHAGITHNLDASWVGLGWYLNTGAINRQQVAVPDDWYRGKAINFITFRNSETSYNIGVGFTTGVADIGVGISWGSNKGVMGSVEASVGLKTFSDESEIGLSGRINSDGDYYIGAYAKIMDGGTGQANVSIGYSSSGDWSFSVGGSDGFASTGINFNSSGTFSINAGFGRNVTKDNGISGGGASLSMGSFTSGDYDVSVDSKGFKVNLLLVGVPVYIKFGRTKVEYSLKKGYEDIAYGSLYSSEALNAVSFNRPDRNFKDYQGRYIYMDVYEQPLPQEQPEYISDFRPNQEKLNFTYAGYDNFEVQANGVNGRLKPRLFDNVTLFNRGINAKSTTSSGKKTHVFYHRSDQSAKRQFGGGNHQMHMYFEGAFSAKEIIEPSEYDFTGNKLRDLVNNPDPGRNTFTNNHKKRATSPSFVEVFTNRELFYDCNRLDVIEPAELPFDQRNSTEFVDPDGIGYYKITSPDGKTYHFTIPVYQFEIVKRTLLKESRNGADIWNARYVSENRQYNRYATHWLLTAITGPDYIDVNNDRKVGEEDYGYWIRLDYGKWSDGYTWKQPYEDNARLYTTNELNKIDDGDFGYFSFGRKQLYYLNKIVSREHTALFIKDIRHDAVGRGFTYRFLNENNGGKTNIGSTGENNGQLNASNEDLYVRERGTTYRKEYSLKLDRIALVKNDVAHLISPNMGNGLGNVFNGYQKNKTVDGGWNSSDFIRAYKHIGGKHEYKIHQEDNMLDINDYNSSGIRANVLREVRFSHSYDLAKKSPTSPIASSQNPHQGKLTLDSLHFCGKEGADYMPPYIFEYYDEHKHNISLKSIREQLGNDNTTAYRREYVIRKNEEIDNWGFIEGDEDRWSLKSIKMPTGGRIKIIYEEDQYGKEAFSRRIINHGLKFRWDYIDGSQDKWVRIQTNSSLSPGPKDWRKYIQKGKPLLVNMRFLHNPPGPFSGGPLISTPDKDGEVIIKNVEAIPTRVEENILELRLPPDNGSTITSRNYNWLVKSMWTVEGHEDHNFICSSKMPRPDRDGTNFCVKIIANKSPENEFGGGLRVSKIETISSDGNVGVLEYKYNFPPGHQKAGRPSGVTSFAPVDGLKYVPYQTELPTPGVQYEYVTLYRKNGNNDTLDYTRYNFHVLNTSDDIFDPQFNLDKSEVEDGLDDSDESRLFWTKVEENKSNKIKAKKIHVHVNTAILGQFKKIEQFNAEDQLISKVTYDYTNGIPLDNAGKGRVQESFNSLKSVFETNEAGDHPVLKNRLLSISTRTDYSNMLKKVTNYANGIETSVEYDDVDPLLGSYRKSYTTRADGTKKMDYRIPAYEIYPEMGPKSLNYDNKNMLTQQVMSISSVGIDGLYKTTNASVTTWRNSSYYDNANTITNDSIWRKHESFVYKDDLDAEGTFGKEVLATDFNWTNTENNPKWQKISETTRYNHWSAPLEVKDVNDNYAATKMGENNTKVYASGNAGYNELFYSGAEDLDGADFSGNVGKGTATLSTDNVHTGTYSLRLNSGQKAYVVSVIEGKTDQYKASLWAKYTGHQNTRLRVAGNTITARENETIRAGDWVQMNFYFTVNSTKTVEVFTSGGTIYVDDFRLHPITTSMNSYVYNMWDELIFIIGSNNMAVCYEYDNAGRLSETYTEVEDFNGPGSGGFKIVSENKYNYQK